MSLASGTAPAMPSAASVSRSVSATAGIWRPRARRRAASPGRAEPASGLRLPRCRSASVTRSAVITWPGAPVHVTTKSAAAMRLARSDISAARPPADAASRSARGRVRLATTSAAGPALATLATTSPLIAPAPTTRTSSRPVRWAVRGGRSAAAVRPLAGSAWPGPRRGAAQLPQPDADQAGTGLADAGLRLRALARPQGQRAESRQRPAKRALLPGEPQGLAQLAENLALADDHRVQTAGHSQQVLHRPVLVVHVQGRRQLGLRHVRVPG